MPDARKIIAATAGAAAATGLAVAAGRKLKPSRGSEDEDGARRPPVVYHVKPDGEGWTVAAQGAERASGRHDTKREALEQARELANRQSPSKLIIHRRDGTIQRQHAYGVEA